MEWRESFDMTTIPDEVFFSELGRRRSNMRQTFGHGNGRPLVEDRCPCGLMTRTRAEKRKHKCVAPKRTRKKAA